MNEIKGNPNSREGNLKNLLFKFCFQSSEPNLKIKIGNYFVLGIAYFAGAFHWAWFLNYGRVEYKYIDWQKFFDYYGVIQKALAENTIPYFMPYFYKGTNQFLAIPETDLSPSIFLLKFLSVEEFFLAQCLILYSLGFVGCLWLKKKYRWSLFAFLSFFLVFNFNGHIVAHLAFSHWPWISYFLLPFFILWVLTLVEGDRSPAHGARLAGVLFGILLLGGLHPFFWCLLFLALLCLYQRNFFKPVLIGVGLSLVFSAYRIVPAMITFFGYKNNFVFGFPSIPAFLESMIVIKDFKTVLGPVLDKIGYFGWWEMDHYIGLLGFGVILYFGIYRRRFKNDTWQSHDYRVLDGPMVVITLLSMSYIYGLLTHLPVPLITVERVSSRFFIMPLLFLLTLSVIGMQQSLDRVKWDWNRIGLALSALLLEGLMLLSHSFAWQVKDLQIRMKEEAVNVVDPVSEWAQSMEEFYVPVVQISFLISLTAIVVFLGTVWIFKLKRRPARGRPE